MLQKTNVKDIFKDSDSSALINTNASAYKQYKQLRNSNKTIDHLNYELSLVRKEVDELKQLIQVILKEKNG